MYPQPSNPLHPRFNWREWTFYFWKLQVANEIKTVGVGPKDFRS